MLRVKGADTLCPLGPGLVSGWDFHDKWIRIYDDERSAPVPEDPPQPPGRRTVTPPVVTARTGHELTEEGSVGP
jgi:hypothetical protein